MLETLQVELIDELAQLKEQVMQSKLEIALVFRKIERTPEEHKVFRLWLKGLVDVQIELTKLAREIEYWEEGDDEEDA